MEFEISAELEEFYRAFFEKRVVLFLVDEWEEPIQVILEELRHTDLEGQFEYEGLALNMPGKPEQMVSGILNLQTTERPMTGDMYDVEYN